MFFLDLCNSIVWEIPSRLIETEGKKKKKEKEKKTSLPLHFTGRTNCILKLLPEWRKQRSFPVFRRSSNHWRNILLYKHKLKPALEVTQEARCPGCLRFFSHSLRCSLLTVFTRVNARRSANVLSYSLVKTNFPAKRKHDVDLGFA